MQRNRRVTNTEDIRFWMKRPLRDDDIVPDDDDGGRMG